MTKTPDTTRRFPLTTRQFLLPFALVTSLFFLWGFARAILDVLNKHLQNELNISITQSALIQVTTYLGYFLMAIPAGWFINRRGYRPGVVFGLLLFGSGALLFIPSALAGTFYAYLGALFIIGCGLVFLETAANPYVTELGAPQTSTARLNFSQSFNGLGGLSATFFVGQFLFRGESSETDIIFPYATLGIVVLIIALVFSRVQLPEIHHKEKHVAHNQDTRIMQLFHHHPMFVFGLLTLLAYEISEISINSYFINYVTAKGWMTDNTASVILTIALGLFMLGRFAGSWLMSFIRAERVLFICAAGSVGCMGLVMLNLGRLSLCALIVNYVFEAIMFPTIFSLSLRHLGTLTKSASSLLMMTPIGGCGFLLMGIIADTSHLMSLPFIIPFLGFFIVLLFASEQQRRIVKSKD